jgi:hypothetical protein
MQSLGRLLIAAVGLALPVAASAQPASHADQAYCAALSNTYVRYIGHDEDNSHNLLYLRGSLDAQVAVAKCKQGDAAAAISVLERTLWASSRACGHCSNVLTIIVVFSYLGILKPPHCVLRDLCSERPG